MKMYELLYRLSTGNYSRANLLKKYDSDLLQKVLDLGYISIYRNSQDSRDVVYQITQKGKNYVSYPR